MTTADHRAVTVLADVVRHPIRHFVTNWNWKSSLTSASSRSLIFFAFNAPAGLAWATRAMLTELVFRAAASGVLGSLSQALRHSRPRVVPLILLPAIGHFAEFVVHTAAGTPRLSASMLASVSFSVLTTAFTLFAMRRGVLIVGPSEAPIWSDLRQVPGLIAAFIASGMRALRPAAPPGHTPEFERTRCSRRRSI